MKTHNSLLALVLVITFSLSASAQTPTWLYAKSAGGTYDDGGQGVAADINGNIFTTGSFKSPSVSFGNTTLANGGPTGVADIFINKYDANGNSVWAHSSGGNGNDFGASVATDLQGNLYVTGFFESSAISFGNTTLVNADNAGFGDIFIVKYDTSGSPVWAKNIGGVFDDQGQSVGTDASGNVYVAGSFNSPTIAFGNTRLTNADTTGTKPCFFVAKFDAQGNVLWAKSAAGVSAAKSVSADANGDIVVAGYYSSDSLSLGNAMLTNGNGPAHGDDVFVAKYDANGNLLWAKRAGGTLDDIAFAAAIDPTGNITVTGYFTSSSITFGTTTLTNVDQTGHGFDIFIVRYDVSGNVAWAKSAGGTSFDAAFGLSVDFGGNALVTGYFSSSEITFGSNTLLNSNSLNGNSNIFVVKYDLSGNVLWAQSAQGTGSIWAQGVTADANGNAVLTGGFDGNATLGSVVLTNADASGFSSDIFMGKFASCSLAPPAITEIGGVLSASITDSVQWFYNGSMITGAISATYQPSQSGYYTAVIANAGCYASSAPFNYVTTGIPEIESDISFSIFPNPSTTGTNIGISDKMIGSTLILTDMMGRKIDEEKLGEVKSSLNTSNLAGGVYLITLSLNAQSLTQKLVINK